MASSEWVVPHSLFFVSITIVTGPSFNNSTFISAPNSPVLIVFSITQKLKSIMVAQSLRNLLVLGMPQ